MSAVLLAHEPHGDLKMRCYLNALHFVRPGLMARDALQDRLLAGGTASAFPEGGTV
jgi:hypothetical protein